MLLKIKVFKNSTYFILRRYYSLVISILKNITYLEEAS